MTYLFLRLWLLLFILVPATSPVSFAAAAQPAIVLVAFGTSTPAAATYEFFDKKVKDRFPGHEVRWAFTSQRLKVRLQEERKTVLKVLPQVLGELKAAGVTQAAVQSLHVVPGEEWDEVVKDSQSVPGLKVASGAPLLNSPEDRAQVLQALEPAFPQDLKNNAVVLVAHGSRHPRGEEQYLAFAQLLQSRFPGQNVFLGTLSGKPTREEALGKVKASGASTVFLVPLVFVAGEHISKDILGDGPDSWKSELLRHKPYIIHGIRQGLGYREGVIQVYLDHLAGALKKVSSEP